MKNRTRKDLQLTIRDIWLYTTYVGVVQLEDDTHLVSNPLLVADSLLKVVFDDNGNFTEYADKKVDHFDFLFGRMRIILKEEEEK